MEMHSSIYSFIEVRSNEELLNRLLQGFQSMLGVYVDISGIAWRLKEK